MEMFHLLVHLVLHQREAWSFYIHDHIISILVYSLANTPSYTANENTSSKMQTLKVPQSSGSFLTHIPTNKSMLG